MTLLEATSLDSYIRSLNYDPNTLLSVQQEGAIEAVALPKERRPEGNAVILTTKTRHTLRKNLSDVAILRPTAGVVFPGALVLADRRLMEGQPVPISLPRGQVTLSVDLPGLRNSRREVTNPTNSSVQDAITDLLNEWHATSGSQGYATAARSFLEVKCAYSSEQIALDLGFSAKWAGGNAATQLNVSTDSVSSSAMAYYKQIYYSVTIDTPARPSQFFGEGVTLEDVRQVASAEHPPAYVRSVDYGRLLLIKMETASRESKASMQGALNHVTSGGVELGGTVDAKYANIVKNSAFTVVAIGGGAQDAANFNGTEEDLKRLREYIQKGATFSIQNPGAPIGYTVAMMKDNQVATMGFTTEYTATESTEYTNGFIGLKHEGWYVAKFEVTWEEPDSQGNYSGRKWESGNKTAGYSHQLDLPGDARGIHIRGWADTGLVWDPWGEAINVTLNAPNNKQYRIYGSTLDRKWD